MFANIKEKAYDRGHRLFYYMIMQKDFRFYKAYPWVC